MSLRNKNKISSRGSVAFTFYFIIALGLLAVAGYYIGINEQTSLFKDIVQRKQTQEDAILNSIADNQSVYTPTASTAKNDAIKSLIDSPNVVLRNLRASHDASVQSGANQNASSTLGNILIGQNVDTNSVETQTIITFAKQAQYLIYTNANKHGSNIKLIDGETKGDVCYNTATERVCYPHYKLEKIWSVGDLNNDGAGDAIISISAEEKILEKNVITDNFYAIISDPNSVTVDKKTQKASSTPISLSPETVSYSVAPFGYGLYSPLISSAEIVDGNAILIGNFYADNDAIGSPSVGKAIRYSFGINNYTQDTGGGSAYASTYFAQKVAEAKLFKEQAENTSLWYTYNYIFDGLDFSFKAPDAWQREENFDKGIKVTFKESGGRSVIFDTQSIIQTCSEFRLNLADSSNVKINNSEFIDLGQFGVGLYIKYAITNNGLNQYHADVCVTDKNNDKKVFSLFSTTREDDVPYYIVFDKIFSTFKVR